MRRFIHKSTRTIGQHPGAAEYVGRERDTDIALVRFRYNADTVEQDSLTPDESIRTSADDGKQVWIDLDGVHDVVAIKRVAEEFEIHPLVVEDVVHTDQRAKLADYDTQLFIVLRMLRWNNEKDEIDDEQVSLILGPSWVLSFQEHPGDVFDPVRERLIRDRGRIRKLQADYLAYALIDAIVDHYFSILETLSDRIEALEEDLTEHPKTENLDAIRHLKRELLFMRKSIWPLREVLSGVLRNENQLLQEDTRLYLQDVYDHTIQIIDTVETFRDMVSGLMDVYLSSISNRMNEVMKVLTIIATIFIPLSFVAGLYGMNFVYMPELHWRYGYFGALGLMLLIGVGMLAFFRRKKWL